jgi:DNA polymerase
VRREQRAALRYFLDLGFEEVRRPERAAAGAGRHARATARRSEGGEPRGPAPELGGDDAEPRRRELEVVRNEALACVACRLSEGRKNVVFGSGNEDAELMFVGEGPGANEDLQGLPFVGAAGELLTRIIQAIELRREDVYIANVVKCRPPNNRDPQPDEVAACIGFLRRQVDLVQPRVLVALGRVAAQTMLACTTPVGRLRGAWHEFQGVPLRVTYHPAALLRSPDLKRPTWADMQEVRERLRAAALDR